MSKKEVPIYNWNTIPSREMRPGLVHSDFRGNNVVVGRSLLHPGMVSKPHKHVYEQIFMILEGRVTLHIEDQVAPKKCGHIAGKQVIPTEEFCDKIRAAAEYRTDPDFVIIARTDARAVTGLDDAIDRGNRYAAAGADVIFFEAPQTEDEIRQVAREIKAPLLANMVIGGKTPAVPVSELERMGFKMVIFPAVCMAAAVPAMEKSLAYLKEHGTDWQPGPVLAPMDIFRRVGFDWWHGIEEKFAQR